MKVLFIRPKPSKETIGLQHLMVVEPLELEMLATLISNDHTVKIVDMILEKKPVNHFIKAFNPDVLCLTGYITHIPAIINILSEARHLNHQVKTVVGGVHVEKFPEDIEHDAIDYRVVRNATRTFPQLIDFIAGRTDVFPAGVLQKGELLHEASLPEYDFFVPAPDRSLTTRYRKRYFYVFHNKVALVKTSFGCPYQCTFCFCRKITGDKYYARPLPEVINELAGIREKEIYIVDDNFLVSAQRTREFIRLLKVHQIRKEFLVYGRADFIAGHPDLIHDFKTAGLRTVIVGLESFEDHELDDYNKQTTRNINQLAMEVLNRYKVDCYAAVIVSPTWDHADFQRAGEIMLELGVRFVNLQPLTPLKGTGIEVSEEELVIDRGDYAKWDLAHVTIRPKHMTVKEFYISILNLYLRILYHPRHLLLLLQYPLMMQIRMAIGLRRVIKQYKQRIKKVSDHA